MSETFDPPPQVTGIYETHLTVRNLDLSIAFYRDIVGLELARLDRNRGMAFFWVGGKKHGMLGLWQTGSGPMSMRLHFAFAVSKADILLAPATLVSKGVEPLGFNGEPVTEPVVLGWMPALSLYFKDPDGHSIEYICVLDEEPDPEFGNTPWSGWLRKRN